jgi:hypothetical protein
MGNEIESVKTELKEKIENTSSQTQKKSQKMAYAFSVGMIVVLMTIIDCLVAPLFAEGKSFMWIAFISWTLFSSSPKMERYRSLLGYVLGYFVANTMIWASSNFDLFTGLHFHSFSIGTLSVGFFINMLIARYGAHASKIFSSIPAMFLGMSFTFSGLGAGMAPKDIHSLAVILIYGTVGVAACFACDFFAKKFLNNNN